MTVKISGVKAIKGRLAAYEAKMLAPVDMWEEIARELSAAEHSWFEAEGEGSWAPLSVEYAAAKAAEFPGRPILQATGDLLDWMTNPAMAMKMPAPDIMEWVNAYTTPDGKWNIAQLHRDGTPKMPARNPVVPTERLHALSLAAAKMHAAW